MCHVSVSPSFPRNAIAHDDLPIINSHFQLLPQGIDQGNPGRDISETLSAGHGQVVRHIRLPLAVPQLHAQLRSVVLRLHGYVEHISQSVVEPGPDEQNRRTGQREHRTYRLGTVHSHYIYTDSALARAAGVLQEHEKRAQSESLSVVGGEYVFCLSNLLIDFINFCVVKFGSHPRWDRTHHASRS